MLERGLSLKLYIEVYRAITVLATSNLDQGHMTSGMVKSECLLALFSSLSNFICTKEKVKRDREIEEALSPRMFVSYSPDEHTNPNHKHIICVKNVCIKQ